MAEARAVVQGATQYDKVADVCATKLDWNLVVGIVRMYEMPLPSNPSENKSFLCSGGDSQEACGGDNGGNNHLEKSENISEGVIREQFISAPATIAALASSNDPTLLLSCYQCYRSCSFSTLPLPFSAAPCLA